MCKRYYIVGALYIIQEIALKELPLSSIVMVIMIVIDILG